MVKDKTVMHFLNTGKAFRASKNSGHVVVVESDAVVRVCMNKWAKKLGRTVSLASSLSGADKKIGGDSVILLVGLDGLPEYDTTPFLQHINDYHPSSFIIAYTSDVEKAYNLGVKMPRITTIVKGEGIDGLLDSIEHEVPKRR